ncbi:MAG: hypothetical protein CM15mP103_09900 [Gammaproteobacteria bacterium]|nr:MAG: hypothetical protein CM15mP103_09900 [Gammaproteobacteria bacterium]
MWKNNIRRFNERTATLDLMHKYATTTRCLCRRRLDVTYEIMQPGGSVEHWNEESGELGCAGSGKPMKSASGSIRSQRTDGVHPVIAITRQLMDGKMYPDVARPRRRYVFPVRSDAAVLMAAPSSLSPYPARYTASEVPPAGFCAVFRGFQTTPTSHDLATLAFRCHNKNSQGNAMFGIARFAFSSL